MGLIGIRLEVEELGRIPDVVDVLVAAAPKQVVGGGGVAGMVLSEDGAGGVVRLLGDAREGAPGRPTSSGAGCTPADSRMVGKTSMSETAVATTLPAGMPGPARMRGMPAEPSNMTLFHQRP